MTTRRNANDATWQNAARVYKKITLRRRCDPRAELLAYELLTAFADNVRAWRGASGMSNMKMLERFWFGCGGCHGDGHSCPYADELAQAVQPPTGIGRLPIALTSLVVFLLPLLCAILVAHFAGKYAAKSGDTVVALSQGGGLVAGLLLGAFAAKLILMGLYKVWPFPDRGNE